MPALTRAPVSSAAPVVGRDPWRAGRPGNRSVARGFAARAGIPDSNQAGRSSHRKNFFSDYPRGLANRRFLWVVPAADPLPVAPTLAVAFLLSRRDRPVSLLRSPLRPSPGRLPAALAAIALRRLSGVKTLLAPFEQTPPRSRPACRWLSPPRLLIFGITCRILGKAHGRLRLPEAPALERNITPLQGANFRLSANQYCSRKLPLGSRYCHCPWKVWPWLSYRLLGHFW